MTAEAIQYGRVGSNVELVCDVFGIPPPPNIFWYNKYGSQVRQDGMSNHFKIIPKRRKDGIKSTLIIRALTEADFGDYNCTSKNEEGVDFYVIKLKEERKYRLLFFSMYLVRFSLVRCSIIHICLHIRSTGRSSNTKMGRIGLIYYT